MSAKNKSRPARGENREKELWPAPRVVASWMSLKHRWKRKIMLRMMSKIFRASRPPVGMRLSGTVWCSGMEVMKCQGVRKVDGSS